MADKIKLRNGTAAAWDSADPTLLLGERGLETDTLLAKTGDGSTAWTSLPYDNYGLSATKSASYTILDADANWFDVTTGAGDDTLTLPTLADNQDREITIVKVDAGAGVIILDGEGAETIEGNTSYTLVGQYDKVTVRGSAATWLVVSTVERAGIIKQFGNTSAPAGYLACDGSAISRTTYATLFAAISTVWGVGDGSTTFNVPDMRGAFLRGTGSHGSENMADGNDFAGPAVGAFEDDQLQGHRQVVATRAVSGGAGGLTMADDGVFDTLGSATGVTTTDLNTQAFEADATNGTPRTGDETRPFAAGVLYCIKT